MANDMLVNAFSTGSRQSKISLKHSLLGNIDFSLAKLLGGSLVDIRLDLKKYFYIQERNLKKRHKMTPSITALVDSLELPMPRFPINATIIILAVTLYKAILLGMLFQPDVLSAFRKV